MEGERLNVRKLNWAWTGLYLVSPFKKKPPESNPYICANDLGIYQYKHYLPRLMT